MKRIAIACCALFFIACLNTVSAQSEAEMKAWMSYMTPGDMHKMLAKSDGKWSGDMKMWMVNGAPPTISTTMTENKMIMDGRYQVSTHTGNFGGMPFEGVSTTGFDNHKKVFIATWIDNMGTGIMTMEGPWDPATKSITLQGKMIDPATGKEMKVREVFKILDDDTHLMEMYGPDPKTGKEFKTMEVVYKRVK